MSLRITFTLLLCALPIEAFALSADTTTTAAPAAEPGKSQYELSLVLGNESNPDDGIFGPFTYGLSAGYSAANGAGIEATYVRVHEPHMPTFNSALDEAQITLRLAPIDSLTLDATWWKNRTVDMYTSIAGPELTFNTSSVALNTGLYLGSASRQGDVSGRFLGALVGVAMKFGHVQTSLSHLAGLIHTPGDPSSFGKGTYHKTALEASLPLDVPKSFPITVAASIERRYFNFANGGPKIEPIDTYIFVLGLEIGLFE